MQAHLHRGRRHGQGRADVGGGLAVVVMAQEDGPILGRSKRNGRLLYHILPIQMSINQYYERQFQEADLALERQKVTKRLAALERKEGANNADANA